MKLKTKIVISLILLFFSCFLHASARDTISLNGEWMCEPGSRDSAPVEWTHTLRVPGLVDLIDPAMDWKAPKYFWYKKTFTVSVFQKYISAFIKIEQSQYGTEVWINGQNVGYYNGCYTSSEFDISKYVKYGAENILVIRVGQKDTLKIPGAVGGDMEKASYIPGIWGDVSLVLTEGMKIGDIRVVSDIINKKISARIMVKNLQNARMDVSLSSWVVEKKNSAGASKKISQHIILEPDEEKEAELIIDIPDMKLWSPDSPFLYKLVSSIEFAGKSKDICETTFGAREFKIQGADFYLNGKRIFLKGGNIAFHRFLSDPQRKYLVWDKDWIKKVLIDIPKENNFNFFRNHLGQMYNRWYDIADEYGLLLQDEWQFWVVTGTPEDMKQEFSRWIIDNFNHPSIVIWDVLNEPNEGSKEAKMINEQVIPDMKKLDPTRPWEYADFQEEHPYIYSLGPVLNDTKLGYSRSLEDIRNSSVPTLLNEFVWFWFSGKGEPTWLMDNVLSRWLGPVSTVNQRLEFQAFIASELVEQFRRMRVDGIAPFVYLSIDAQATANWFLDDIKDLKPKPILNALKSAYASFGVSIELWDRHFYVDEERKINIYFFNDDPVFKQGLCHVIISDTNGKIFSKREFPVEVEASGMKIVPVNFVFPDAPGKYFITATLGSNEPALSKKVAYVFKDVPALSVTPSQRVVVLDLNDELLKFIRSKNVNAVDLTSASLKDGDLLVIGPGGLNDKLYLNRFSAIERFVRKGNVMLIIEPEFGAGDSTDLKLPCGNILMINRRNSRFEGGYDSYVFKGLNTDPSLWDGIDDGYLKFFNGGYGGVIVNDYNVFPDKPFFTRAVCGLALGTPVVMEFKAGAGLIAISRIQTRGRLLPASNENSLYSLRSDPVAQKFILNLLQTYSSKDKIFSLMNLEVEKTKPDGKKILSSSVQLSQYPPENAFDQNDQTRWSSAASDPQWIIIDLGSEKSVSSVRLKWETAYGKEYKILASRDASSWETLCHEKNGKGGVEEIQFSPVTARYVCLFGIKRGTQWGYSLWEMEVK